jgi:hypothetical protein
MLFNQSDYFVKFLRNKAHTTWSTEEVIEIFKRRYGKDYQQAMANFLMDSLQTFTSKPRLNKGDKEFAANWEYASSKKKNKPDSLKNVSRYDWPKELGLKKDSRYDWLKELGL